MAETITHAFISAKTDSVDTTLVSASEWNDGHVFSGGLNGQVLVYDNTQPNNMRWTDGASAYKADAVIVSGTTSPQANFLTLSFTTATTCVLQVNIYFAALTTGAVNTIYTANIDGVPFIAGSIVENGTERTQARAFPFSAGSHLIDIDMATVGDVTWLGGSVQITVLAFGV